MELVLVEKRKTMNIFLVKTMTITNTLNLDDLLLLLLENNSYMTWVNFPGS